jgi:hypothetical protein
VLTFGVQPGAWVGAVVELSGHPFGDEEPTVALTEDGDVLTAAVSWPDGRETTTHLTGTRGATAPEADRDPGTGHEHKEL